MSCAECSGELPTIYDVAELDEARARHPTALQERVEEIRSKHRDLHDRRRGWLKLVRSA